MNKSNAPPKLRTPQLRDYIAMSLVGTDYAEDFRQRSWVFSKAKRFPLKFVHKLIEKGNHSHLLGTFISVRRDWNFRIKHEAEFFDPANCNASILVIKNDCIGFILVCYEDRRYLVKPVCKTR